MKARAAVLQGVLALAGLGAAYATWQRPSTVTIGEVAALDLSRREVKRIRFEDADHWVELVPGEHAGDRAIWVKSSPAKADARAPAELLGNDLAERVVDRFAPLLAERDLGVLDAKKLEELGLAATKQHLSVEARGAQVRFSVSTAFGLGQPYLRDERSGQVYVLNGTLLSDLEAPARLVDRRLHAFEPDEFDRVTVKAGEHTRTLVAIPQPATYLPKLASPRTPTTPDVFAKNWHDELWRLTPTEVLGRDELPPSGTPSVLVRVDYERRGAAVGFLELGKSGSDGYARSEHTAGWVKLGAQADSLVHDAERVASGG
jgi:hypothetical protein